MTKNALDFGCRRIKKRRKKKRTPTHIWTTPITEGIVLRLVPVSMYTVQFQIFNIPTLLFCLLFQTSDKFTLRNGWGFSLLQTFNAHTQSPATQKYIALNCFISRECIIHISSFAASVCGGTPSCPLPLPLRYPRCQDFKPCHRIEINHFRNHVLEMGNAAPASGHFSAERWNIIKIVYYRFNKSASVQKLNEIYFCLTVEKKEKKIKLQRMFLNENFYLRNARRNGCRGGLQGFCWYNRVARRWL